jgi:hypothetical protein
MEVPMKVLALAFALILALAAPSFAHPVGGHGGSGGQHWQGHGHVGGFGGFHGGHAYHRGFRGGFIGGPYGGPYYGDPCWNWVPVLGWVYVCE